MTMPNNADGSDRGTSMPPSLPPLASEELLAVFLRTTSEFSASIKAISKRFEKDSQTTKEMLTELFKHNSQAVSVTPSDFDKSLERHAALARDAARMPDADSARAPYFAESHDRMMLPMQRRV
ncbi:SubName: Full=Uncharacterized protein {ECO:0000313/EMBL:CCA75292.1} [Serendipita indica DSM 11827]|nr:SubName: Full=Uncharacterized protein {ECO:0000313/EMBL:CCA75292.1} [Serendipita indica DSM 11827]